MLFNSTEGAANTVMIVRQREESEPHGPHLLLTQELTNKQTNKTLHHNFSSIFDSPPFSKTFIDSPLHVCIRMKIDIVKLQMLQKIAEHQQHPTKASPPTHSWAKFQKPAKNEIQKNRKIDGSYLCLQRFDKFLL